MNAKIAVTLAIIAFLGLGGYYAYNSTRSSSTTAMESPVTSEENTDGSFSGNFLDLLALGASQQCTFSSTDDAGAMSSGEVFVTDSGDKFYGQFSSEVEGNIVISHVLRTDGYNYIWSDGQTQGFKAAISEEDMSLFGQSADSDMSIDDDTNVDFDCNAWVVDNSLFTLPSGITFVDFSEQLEAAAELKTNASGEADLDCSVCDSVPEAARAQCLTGLGC